MAKTLLYIFDTTDGVDGAPCKARMAPGPTQKKVKDSSPEGFTMVPISPPDPAALIGVQSAVAVESDLFEANQVRELALNADGVSIDVVPGFSEDDQAKVNGIRVAIAEPLLDAIGLAIVDIATAPEIQTVIKPETKRLIAKVADLLRVTNVSDGPDLDEASGKVDDVETILAARPTGSGRGGRP